MGHKVTTAIISIIGGVIAAVGGYFSYRNSPIRNRRAAEEEIDKQQHAAEERRNKARKAVLSHDNKEVNKIMQNLIRPLMAIALCAAIMGCKTDVQYIDGSLNMEMCTNSTGEVCWAVPDKLMLEIISRLQTLQDLERKERVEARLK